MLRGLTRDKYSICVHISASQVFHLSDANNRCSTVIWKKRITVQQMSLSPFFHVYTLLPRPSGALVRIGDSQRSHSKEIYLLNDMISIRCSRNQVIIRRLVKIKVPKSTYL